MKTAVVDASILVKLVVEEEGTPQALTLLGRGDEWIAPDWVRLEVASALWEKVKLSQLLEIHAARCLAAATQPVDALVSSIDLIDDAFQLSVRLRHPVYDCIYLALAMQRACAVLTADKKFARAAQRARLSDHIDLLTWGTPDHGE